MLRTLILTHWLDLLTPDQASARPSPDRTEAGARSGKRLAAAPARHPRNQRVIPRSRDFR